MLMRLQKAWGWVKWGRLREETKDAIEHIETEYAVYSCRTGKMVGYRAYGHFDPMMPYTGQDAYWATP